jgi:hypothetical protein
VGLDTSPPQSAAASSRAGASASTVALEATSVQSGGRGGGGGYCVGRRLMSHGAVFLGCVFMWCLVPFFCGRDEHSTASAARPPHPGRRKPTDGEDVPYGGARRHVQCSACGEGSAAVWDKTGDGFGLGLFCAGRIAWLSETQPFIGKGRDIRPLNSLRFVHPIPVFQFSLEM